MKLSSVDSIIKAVCVLHNFIRINHEGALDDEKVVGAEESDCIENEIGKYFSFGLIRCL